MSRRSELRSLQQEILRLEQDMTAAETRRHDSKKRSQPPNATSTSMPRIMNRSATELMEARLKTGTARDRVKTLARTTGQLQHESEESLARRQAAQVGHRVLHE